MVYVYRNRFEYKNDYWRFFFFFYSSIITKYLPLWFGGKTEKPGVVTETGSRHQNFRHLRPVSKIDKLKYRKPIIVEIDIDPKPWCNCKY